MMLATRRAATLDAESVLCMNDRAQRLVLLDANQQAIFDALPTIILALNTECQVLFANRSAAQFLGRGGVDDMLGKRPGELMGCVNVQSSGACCGASRQCRECGAMLAILAAVRGVVSESDCRLLRRENGLLEGLDLHVCATPLDVAGQRLVIFAITDVSHETRRRTMERIFFHDVLNLASGISGFSGVLMGSAPDGLSSDLKLLHTASQNLVDEIVAQRELLAAETNDLTPVLSTVAPVDIMLQLQDFYSKNPVAQGQSILLTEDRPSVFIETDARLVLRVLGNMLKNALEAGSFGDTVTLSYAQEEDTVVFRVHNEGVMPESVRESIFRRQFSTKGVSRGLGTYSMMLIAERYLGGSVGFASTEENGTTFHLRLLTNGGH